MKKTLIELKGKALERENKILEEKVK